MEHRHDHQRPPSPTDETDWAAMGEVLELDGEVLRSYLDEVMGWIRHLAGDRPCRRVLDLGSGPGVATLALAQRFSRANVIAVDASAPLLARTEIKALDLGLADRVHTIRADLDLAWPAIDPVDLVWASMSLHHLAHPDRVLKDVFATIHPGGLVAVAEMRSPLRFLPDDIRLGRPGLETRCLAALPEGHAGPHLDSDWASHLDDAGFAVVAERTFTIDLTPPLPVSTGRYAQGWLQRMRPILNGRIALDDLATLDTLIDSDGPAGILRRDDLVVRGSRTVWVAQRP